MFYWSVYLSGDCSIRVYRSFLSQLEKNWLVAIISALLNNKKANSAAFLIVDGQILAYYALIMLEGSLLCWHNAQCFTLPIMPKIMLA